MQPTTRWCGCGRASGLPRAEARYGSPVCVACARARGHAGTCNLARSGAHRQLSLVCEGGELRMYVRKGVKTEADSDSDGDKRTGTVFDELDLGLVNCWQSCSGYLVVQ